jgi:HEAT repeat protein
MWLTAVLAAAIGHVPIRFNEPARAASTTLEQPALSPDDQDTASAQVRQLSDVLSDPSATQQQRDEAARRLARLPLAQARLALLVALQTPQNTGGQLAVARALADIPDPHPDFISPLFAVIGGNRNLTEEATAALANYKRNPEVQTRLIDLSARRAGPEWIRYSAIRALGASADKRSAEALMRLLRNPDESAQIRNRAADALAAITGISDYGQDLALWEQWWAQAQRRSDVDFRDDVLTRKASQHDRDQAHINRLADVLATALGEQYEAAPAEQKEGLLLRWLRSDEPVQRTVGVEQASRDFQATRPVPSSVRDQIRAMVGDSSGAVRKAAAITLRTLGDATAVEPLLQQLTVESDPAVRIAMATALGQLAADSQQETKAAPVLMRLLASGSNEVADAAAAAIRVIGPPLVTKDPLLARQVALALKGVVDRTANPKNPSDNDLRRDVVEALAPFKQREFISLYLPMLNPNREAKPVRIAALHALAYLGERQTADQITEQLKDPDDDIVIEAIGALGSVAPLANQLEALRPLLDPANRRIPAIRDTAWHVIESSLPQMRDEDLNQWAHRFGTDWKEPQRQILVLKSLASSLTASKKLDELATTQQQIADASMLLSPKDLESAVIYYKLALEYYQAQNRGLELDYLTRAYLSTLLESGKFSEAINFTQTTLARDPVRQPQMASAIRAHADTLVQNGGQEDLRRAGELIDLALKMQPPLANQYLGQLQDKREEINKKLSESPPPTTGPRSATGSMPRAAATREIKVAKDG